MPCTEITDTLKEIWLANNFLHAYIHNRKQYTKHTKEIIMKKKALQQTKVDRMQTVVHSKVNSIMHSYPLFIYSQIHSTYFTYFTHFIIKLILFNRFLSVSLFFVSQSSFVFHGPICEHQWFCAYSLST